MNDTNETQERLTARGRARLVASPDLLIQAFPVPPVARLNHAPVLATGLAAAAAAIAPFVAVPSDPAVDRLATSFAFDLAEALAAAEGTR